VTGLNIKSRKYLLTKMKIFIQTNWSKLLIGDLYNLQINIEVKYQMLL